MKLKEQRKIGIIFLIAGAALFGVGLLTAESESLDWLSSFGSAIAFLGIARLLRVYRLSRDEDRAADYDASIKDERTAYVANKARSLTFFICMYAQLAASFLAIVVFRQTLVGQVLCIMTCVQAVIYSVCFWYFNRKY